MKIAISEVFYSLQGEGKTTGVPSVFVRLGGCNLMCGGQGTQDDKQLHNGATWRCDTIEVWMVMQRKEIEDVLPPDCVKAIKNGAHMIITGGEPTIQATAVNKFIKYVREEIDPSVFIEVETNGTNVPNLIGVDQWNCSPKLSNSGNEKSLRYRPDALEALNKLNTQFKFVISSKEDYEEMYEDFAYLIDKKKVWLMPAGENQKQLEDTKLLVAELAKEFYLNFTTRLHIDLWDRKTGV